MGPECIYSFGIPFSFANKKKKVHLLLIYIISVYLNTLPPTTQHIHYPIILLSTQKKKTYIRLNSLKYTRHLTAFLDPIYMYMHAGNSSKPFCMHEWNRFLFIGLYLIHWHGLLWIWGWKYKKRLFIKQKDKRKQVITHMKINLYM